MIMSMCNALCKRLLLNKTSINLEIKHLVPMNAARRRPFPLLYFRHVPSYKPWVYPSLPYRRGGAIHAPLGPSPI